MRISDWSSDVCSSDRAALDLVEDRGEVRGTIGAINTVFRAEDGALVGTITDAGGFFAPIAALDLDDAPEVVMGAGGAARAVQFALATMRVGRVPLVTRSVERRVGTEVVRTCGYR